MKQKIEVISTIIATLIGAGFASGQEIYTFFYVYGKKGIYGLAICCLLFMFIIYKVFKVLLENNIVTYKDFINLLIGKYGFILNTIVNLFLLITFFIMIAGFGAYFSQEIGISTYTGSGILACLCFLTFIANTNGITKVSSFLVPILITLIILIGFINFSYLDINLVLESLPDVNSFNWLLSSILYTSYNSILLIPVLITFKKNIETKNDIFNVSIYSGIILFILTLLIFFMLTKINIDISKLEMPVIYVVNHFYQGFKQIYAFIILASIYTTAISIGIGFLENTCKSKKNYTLIVLIMCISGFSISGFGFSNLITKLYPFFGYIGLIQICLLFIACQ